jgi:hypothetical protein
MDEVRGDQRRDVELGMMIAERRLEVEGIEGPKQVEGQKNHQPESFYGPGMMTVDVIGMPIGGQLPKRPVLDHPPGVAEANDRGTGGLDLGDRRHPDPLRLERLLLPIPLPDYSPPLHRAHDPNRSERRPRRQVFDVPDLTDDRPLLDDRRELPREDPAGILEQIATFVFQDEDDVFLMTAQQRYQRPFDIEPVGQDEVERPGVSRQQTLQEPGRAGDFVFPLPLGFHIQKKRNRCRRDHGQHQPVIILDSPIRQPSLQTPRTASPERRVRLVPVEDQNVMPRGRAQGLVPLEPRVRLMQGRPEGLPLELRENTADRIRAGQRASPPAKPARPALLQSMETAQSGGDHQKDAEGDRRGRIAGKGTGIRQPGQLILKMIASLDIGEEAPKNGLPLLLFESVPIDPGNFFQQVLDVAITLDPESDFRLLIFGDVELFDLAVDAAGED